MNVEIVERNNRRVAVVSGELPIITDGQSALEFVVNIGYEHECRGIAVPKAAFAENFFRLATGVAGEVAQKFVNYGYRVAVFGDFSGYTSQPLQDYIRESNKGRHLYFVADEEAAVRRLTK